MKVFFATARNPHFVTITEYVERALRAAGCEVSYFDDRAFLIPGRLRKGPLHALDLALLNRRLRAALEREKPDLLLECGGERVTQGTVEFARKAGIKTVLWTIDPVRDAEEFRIENSVYYDQVFCGGSEMLHYLARRTLRNPAQWLPFACDPELHAPVQTGDDNPAEGADAVFVGSLHAGLYPRRLKMLQAAAKECRLALWGPGAENLGEPLKSCVRGSQTKLEDWVKIYSSAPITLCLHYQDPAEKLLCHQASPRVYEAMACGAFVICDAQQDVLRLFQDGRHLCVAHNSAELREKIAYYLARPQERAAIARAGRQEVLEHHTYARRVEKILSWARQA